VRRARDAAIAAGAAVLGLLAFRLLRDDLDQTVARSLPTVAIGWTAVAAGLIAWERRPGNRVGPLMAALGLSVLVRPWQYADSALLFTVGFALSQLNVALFGHVTLAYPSGRVTDRLELWLVRAGYAAAIVFPIATLLVYDGSGLRYVPPGPESLLLLTSDADLARDLEEAFVLIVYGALAVTFVALVIRRLARATARERRLYAPMLLAAILAALRAISECAFVFVSAPRAIADRLYWWQVAGQILLPIALLVGLLESRLARAHIGDLVLELDRASPNDLERALRRHLSDPTLALAYSLPGTAGWVDATGAPVSLPSPGERRSVTVIEDQGEPIAAIVHDPSLDDEPELMRAAGAAAKLALENARLHAEVLAQLAQVQESRRRIVEAGDEQRRRIERDIHDGAQQRLVALALELRATQRRLGSHADPDVDEALDRAVQELQLAVSELRELARGVHPAILTEDGLAAALESLAARTPLRVTVEQAPEGRLPPEVEAAAYFVACEALANAAKHAQASRVTIGAVHAEGMLVVQVEDDGRGGADAGRGTGLRGLADRVEAHGGTLTVESPPGGPTCVTAEIPCAS
jgi:signal transduction histidine kinase